MQTVVKVLETQQTDTSKAQKAIVFSQLLFGDTFKTPSRMPSDFRVIELICRNYTNNGTHFHTGNMLNYDLMFAYNEDRNRGVMYLGHFNDGVV